jgi:hypothetical protein
MSEFGKSSTPTRVEREAEMANHQRWGIVPVYLLCGLIPGMADGALGGLARQLGVRPGWATALIVNIFLPLAAVGLGAAVPLLRTVWVGAVVMTAAYIAGLAISHPPGAPMNLAALPALVHPILVVACAGYGVIGTCTALARRRRLLISRRERVHE